jgi:hypothetical protein
MAPVSREITAPNPHPGRRRCIAAPLSLSDPANCGGLPQLCPTFAFFRLTQQAIGKVNEKIQAVSWSDWCCFASNSEPIWGADGNNGAAAQQQLADFG